MTEYDSDATAFPSTGRGGFALVWALVALMLVSLTAAAGFLLSWSEFIASEATLSGVRVFHETDGALWQGVAGVRGSPTGPLTVPISGGSAIVSFTRLVDVGFGTEIHAARAMGYARDLRRGGFGRETQVVLAAGLPPRFPAALVAAGPVDGSRASGQLSGVDATPGCSVRYPTDIAGLAIPTSPPPSLGSGLIVRGSPAWTPLDSISPIRRATWIDWKSVSTGGPPRLATVPPDPWPGTAGAAPWPVIELSGGTAILGRAHSGQGVLIVLNDLTVQAGFNWRGLVLVGGRLRVVGDATVVGVTVVGSDSSLVGAGAVDLGPGRVDFRFESCAAEAGATSLALTPAVFPGSWREVF